MAFRGLRQEQGSFSLYLLLAAGALFTLFLLIFNGLRYILVMQNTEQALESAAISLLSHYEPQLMQEMGIFALTEQAVSPEAAAGYFTDNLNSGAFFGSPACQRFNWRLKETERLDRLQALETQLVKSQAVEGWLNLARRLLQAVETDELRRSLRLLEELPQGEEETTKEDHLWEPLNSFPLSGPTAGERAAEESQKDEISLWHFLSPWPPGGLPKDHRLPKTLLREEGKRLDALALEPSAWSLLFEDLAAVKKQGGGLIAYGSVFSEALIQGLLEAKDKCLRIEYFMGQLDYATAAPSYDRWFEKAEVEYLICGRQSSWSNQRELAMRLFFSAGSPPDWDTSGKGAGPGGRHRFGCHR